MFNYFPKINKNLYNSKITSTTITSINMYILIYVCLVFTIFINQSCNAAELGVVGSSTSLSSSSAITTTTSTSTATVIKPSCNAVQNIFIARGLNQMELPKELKNDVILKYCDIPTTGTCCTYNMEQRLAVQSRMHLDKTTKDSIGKLASILGTRGQKFDDHFKDLLAESKREFHSMFKKTYGVIYEQNAYVFSELFAELEAYYLKGNVDLAEAMDLFFNTLYQKMFTVLNSQYTFDDKYLGCVSEHMKELKPFGDVPDKLSVQIKRSFIATRTFAQSLNKAADIVKTMINVRPSQNCTAALTKMQQCNICSGYSEKPCGNYCVNVIKGCLNSFNELDIEWDNFAVAMDKVAERLLGPFNIVVVVEPINIKISEAIMNFQESGYDISQQVFHGCGKPILGRKRRSIVYPNIPKKIKTDEDINSKYDFLFVTDDEPIINNIDNNDRIKRAADPANRELESYEPVQFTNTDDYSSNKGRRKNKNKNKSHQDNLNEETSDEYLNKEPVIDKLIKDIRQKVRDSKKFWSNLPYQICNTDDMAALPSTKEICWNGHTVDKYMHSVVTGSQINPEMPLSPSYIKNKLVENKLYTLRTVVNHLKNACNGQDVEWRDLEDQPEFGSGSGSGIDDEDIDDGGSGLGAYDSIPDFKPDIIVDRTSNNDNNNNNTITSGGGSSGGTIDISENDIDRPKSQATPLMSKRRALITYIFPIVMAWFGGMFSDLL